MSQSDAEVCMEVVRDILEAMCQRNGIPFLDTTPNYVLADLLGIGHVFGLEEKE